METVTLLVLLLVLLAFTALLIFSIRAGRKTRQAQAQIAQTLGVTPVEPDETLLAQIAAVYNIHVGGNLFTFAEMLPGFKPGDPAQMTQRINRALEIYRLFQS